MVLLQKSMVNFRSRSSESWITELFGQTLIVAPTHFVLVLGLFYMLALLVKALLLYLLPGPPFLSFMPQFKYVRLVKVSDTPHTLSARVTFSFCHHCTLNIIPF